MKFSAASIIAAACLAFTVSAQKPGTTTTSSSSTVMTATKTSTITVPIITTITIGVPTVITTTVATSPTASPTKGPGNAGNALQAVNAKAVLAVGAGVAALAQFL
ncbi:hypothetical protein BGZ89_005577 [Linnemannia elongata]|nr:hypothetical protein BGZ89_005577 [Linnemannia elongata]